MVEINVVIEITDDGMGMTPDLTSRVLDICTQGHVTPDRNSSGLGLGLALVKRLVEVHDESVTASSEGLGPGSMITIQLSLTDEVAEIDLGFYLIVPPSKRGAFSQDHGCRR